MTEAPSSATSEQLLLNEIKTGGHDDSILQQLQHEYKPRLLSFAYLMGIREESADLVQDVFLVAVSAIRSGRFRGDSSLITWLIGILTHKIKDLWRSKTRYRSVFRSLETDATDEECAVWPLNQWDEDIDLRRTLHRMPREFRVILLLNEIEGLTVNEISHKLKKPPGTVGRKLAEAKQTVRDELG